MECTVCEIPTEELVTCPGCGEELDPRCYEAHLHESEYCNAEAAA